MAAPNLTLWGVGTSRTVRPHWALHELGLKYETQAIGPRTGETKTAEYTKLKHLFWCEFGHKIDGKLSPLSFRTFKRISWL